MENTATSPASDSYRITGNDESHMTYAFAEVILPPAAIIRCFGDGWSGDECKVSRIWTFRKQHLVFTLYDWKSTSLFDGSMWSSTGKIGAGANALQHPACNPRTVHSD